MKTHGNIKKQRTERTKRITKKCNIQENINNSNNNNNKPSMTGKEK
jgi:hypothetical protein